MKLSKLSIISALALTFTALVAPAQASVTYPTDWVEFPICAAASDTNCYSNPLVKSPNDSDWVTPPSDVIFYIHGFDSANSPSLVVDMRLYDKNGQQDLSEFLPYGTKIKVDINTGDWQPNPQAHAVAVINGFSQTQDSNSNWITSVEFTTTNWSPASNCTISDGCDAPGTANGNPGDNGYQQPFWSDYASFGQLVFWGVSLSASDDDISWWHKWDGMYTSSNASGGGSPWYDTENSAWVVETAGPQTLSNGTSTNWLTFNAFIPDHSLLEVYGINGADAAPNFVVTRRDGNQSSDQTLAATITHIESPNPGIFINIPRYTFDPTPDSISDFRNIHFVTGSATTTELKIKYLAPTPVQSRINSSTSVDKTITLHARSTANATGYDAQCTKGSTTKSASSSTTTIAVNNLSEGVWKCKVRAKNTHLGPWSSLTNITVSYAPGISRVTGVTLAGNFARVSFNANSKATGINVKCVKGGTTKTGLAMLAFGIAPVKITKGTWKCSVQSVRSYGGKTYYSAWSPGVSVTKR